MSTPKPEQAKLEEPRRRGARVTDADGHIWRRGTTRWSCEAEIGTSYFSKRKRRMVVVESVGRLPWYALQDQYGPLTLVDDAA